MNHLCGHCGRPVASAMWIGDLPYHLECTQPPDSQTRTFQTAPLTEEQVRRIVRDELDRKFSGAVIRG